MKTLYSIYRIAILLPVIIILTVFCAVMIIIISPLFGRSTISHLLTIYTRIALFFIGASVKVEGKENAARGESYIVAINHKSYADFVFVYSSLGLDLRWVMKAELLRVPLLGFAFKMMGNIPVDRSNPIKAVASINQAKQQISKGVSVVFFPEGTRVAAGKIAPFKKGAFHLAKDMQLPVLPVTIVGSEKMAPKGSFKISHAKVKMIIHPPVLPQAYGNDVNRFSDDVRAVIEKSYLDNLC